jgi:hypothetical protein
MLQDVIEEARRILGEAEKRGVLLRLFGGLAIKIHCPSASLPHLIRKYPDIDLMGLSKQSKAIKNLFLELGYAPREVFNRLHGNRRLIFNDMENMRRVDIFLDVFEMCHTFDFRSRLKIGTLTIPLADLLATKLQIVKLNDKDYRDIICLLLDHEIGDSDSEELINGDYIAELCSNDWGIWKTFTQNLNKVMLSLKDYGLNLNEEQKVSIRIRELLKRIDLKPKSMRWKMRSVIGEKIPWYELPEEDKPVVDSRFFEKRKT